MKNEDNKQIFHAFLFNIRNYSPEVSNIQQRKAELSTILPRVNSFVNDKKWHEIFVLMLVIFALYYPQHQTKSKWVNAKKAQ